MNPNEPSVQPEPTPPTPGTVINPGQPASPPPAPTPPPDPAPTPPPAPVAPAPQPPAVQTPPPAAVSVSQPESAPPADLPTEEAGATDNQILLSWQASEYIQHEKRFGWYALFFLVVAGFVAAAAYFHQWLTIGVFVIMAVALVIYAHRTPRVLGYSLGDLGLTIDTKFYPYTDFKTFGVIQDIAWHMIDLEPMRRFMPRLNILFEDDKRDQIIDILTQHMPRHDRQPDFVERAARFLKF